MLNISPIACRNSKEETRYVLYGLIRNLWKSMDAKGVPDHRLGRVSAVLTHYCISSQTISQTSGNGRLYLFLIWSCVIVNNHLSNRSDEARVHGQGRESERQTVRETRPNRKSEISGSSCITSRISTGQTRVPSRLTLPLIVLKMLVCFLIIDELSIRL